MDNIPKLMSFILFLPASSEVIRHLRHLGYFESRV